MKRLVRFLPWVSLAVSLLTGAIMERSPQRAPLVATLVAVGWLIVAGLSVIAQAYVRGLDEEKRPRFEKITYYARVFGLQNITQLAVFFSLPFYVRASQLRFDHGLFLLLLVSVGVVSVWDPLYEWIVARTAIRSVLQAFATFAGLNCVLPMLGLSNRWSLIVAAGATVVGSPLTARLSVRLAKGLSRPLVVQTCLALALPFLLLVGAAGFVPPAPLRLAAAGFGTTVRGHELVDPVTEIGVAPPQLVCFTAIAAPRGLRDELLHVWQKDGRERDRIALDVRGGRAAGYRTWSIKKNLGDSPEGRWTCTVETASGQVLGATHLKIGEAPRSALRTEDVRTCSSWDAEAGPMAAECDPRKATATTGG